jgi:hypothetical protein
MLQTGPTKLQPGPSRHKCSHPSEVKYKEQPFRAKPTQMQSFRAERSAAEEPVFALAFAFAVAVVLAFLSVIPLRGICFCFPIP